MRRAFVWALITNPGRNAEVFGGSVSYVINLSYGALNRPKIRTIA